MWEEQFMEPPWKICNYSQVSMGWRMGGGETYMKEWTDWFYELPEHERSLYRAFYPAPEGWFDFYAEPSTEDECMRMITQQQTLQHAYCDHHLHHAQHAEARGEQHHALVHYEKALTCHFGYCSQHASEMILRYIHLKKQLAQSIGTPSLIQTHWETALSPVHVGVPLELHFRSLTRDDFTQLQEWVILPLEPHDCQWLHVIDDTVLYLFKYSSPQWRAQILFHVIDGAYSIRSAWMNQLLPISEPYRKTAHVVEQLIDRVFACARWVDSQQEKRMNEERREANT